METGSEVDEISEHGALVESSINTGITASGKEVREREREKA